MARECEARFSAGAGETARRDRAGPGHAAGRALRRSGARAARHARCCFERGYIVLPAGAPPVLLCLTPPLVHQRRADRRLRRRAGRLPGAAGMTPRAGRRARRAARGRARPDHAPGRRIARRGRARSPAARAGSTTSGAGCAPYGRFRSAPSAPQLPALPTDAFRFARISSRAASDDLRAVSQLGHHAATSAASTPSPI